MQHFLDFERPIAELEAKIDDLRNLSDAGDINIAEEVARLQSKAERILKQTYGKLAPWQKVQVARHPDRPHFLDYVAGLFTDFEALAGDRSFAEDRAIIGGLARFRGRTVVVIGTEKGHNTQARVEHNFGIARPEGYRKSQRLMRLADRFGLPIITFVDTPGAYPGVGAEERGQAEAIAKSIEVCLGVRVPLVSVIIGEGGSGGAIALAAANTVVMMEHAIYSVISPEGCASILWRSSEKAEEAAVAMRLTAEDLKKLGVIDAIVPEPVGGAHRDKNEAIAATGEAIDRALKPLLSVEGGALRVRRRDKFLAMGQKGLG